MPVVGLNAYDVYGSVSDLVRSLLNDAQSDVYTDSVLLPFANAAYRKVQRALALAGSPLFLVDTALITVSALVAVDPSIQTGITDATADPNQLPTDLLEPVKLWERAAGSTDDLVEMTDMTNNGGLPSEAQGTTLRFWEWREDGIYFMGATQDVQVRLRYKKKLPAFTDASSDIFIRDAVDTIAYFTATLAASSRGPEAAAAAMTFTQIGNDSLNELTTRAVLANQTFGRRRRPYSSRQSAAY